MDNKELKPCPICNGPAEFKYGGEMSSGKRIVKAGCKYGCAEQAIYVCEEEDAARAWNYRAPAPQAAQLTTEQILKARAEGRMEALQIILLEDAESSFTNEVVCSANGDAGDYSTYWDEAKLRAKLHIDDAAYNAFDKAEEAYYEYRGHAFECQIEAELRATSPAPAVVQMTDEQIDYIARCTPGCRVSAMELIDYKAFARAILSASGVKNG